MHFNSIARRLRVQAALRKFRAAFWRPSAKTTSSNCAPTSISPEARRRRRLARPVGGFLPHLAPAAASATAAGLRAEGRL